MFYKFKTPLLVLFLGFIGLWFGSSLFNYFTHNLAPEITMHGIQRDNYYAGTINCILKSNNSYKVAQVSVSLDGNVVDLDGRERVGAKSFQIPFKIDTTELADSLHHLEVEAIDSSYNMNKNKERLDFFVDNMPLKAALLQQDFKVDQGRTVHARIQTNKQLAKAQIRFLENVYNCYPESDHSSIYECFIPVDCEQSADEYLINAELQDYVQNEVKLSAKLNVNSVNFPKQKGFKVAKGKLEEEKEISMSNKILEEALEKWMKDSSKKKMWSGKFVIPIDLQRVATPFGEIRTNPEKGRYLHRAVDILNYPKSVVWASQDGKVIIKDRFLLTGNTVVIDHGLEVFTLYCHLEDFADVEVGNYIKKGNPIGKIGMTGYANGYHLHWELRVHNIAVDPFEWTKRTF
jgi:hypothetical protein